MSANLIANRYAKALLSLSEAKPDKADKFLSFLEMAAGLFTIPEAKKVLRSPVMPSDVKTALLQLAASKVSSDQDVEQFIVQLVSAGRVRLIPDIYDSYRRQLDEQKGIAHATVTTASSLDVKSQDELQQTLSKVFNKKLTVDNKVNPKILGGLVVEVGNFAIDLSVKAKLNTLAEHVQH